MRRCLQLTRNRKCVTRGATNSVAETLENNTLKQGGHINRINNTRWPKRILGDSSSGKKKRNCKIKMKNEVIRPLKAIGLGN